MNQSALHPRDPHVTCWLRTPQESKARAAAKVKVQAEADAAKANAARPGDAPAMVNVASAPASSVAETESRVARADDPAAKAQTNATTADAANATTAQAAPADVIPNQARLVTMAPPVSLVGSGADRPNTSRAHTIRIVRSTML